MSYAQIWKKRTRLEHHHANLNFSLNEIPLCHISIKPWLAVKKMMLPYTIVTINVSFSHHNCRVKLVNVSCKGEKRDVLLTPHYK